MKKSGNGEEHEWISGIEPGLADRARNASESDPPGKEHEWPTLILEANADSSRVMDALKAGGVRVESIDVLHRPEGSARQLRVRLAEGGKKHIDLAVETLVKTFSGAVVRVEKKGS